MNYLTIFVALQTASSATDAELDQFGQSLGHVVIKILLVVAGAAVVLLLVKKYNYVRVIKNIFSWIFMGWGVICLLLYFVNLLNGENFPYLNAGGLISFAVGFGLRRIKVAGSK